MSGDGNGNGRWLERALIGALFAGIGVWLQNLQVTQNGNSKDITRNSTIAGRSAADIAAIESRIADRFTGQDGQEMEARMRLEIKRVEDRLRELERGGYP